MKVTVENKKGLNKDIKVFIDKKTMDSYMDEKYEEIKATVNLKGFRPGKVIRIRPATWPVLQVPREEYIHQTRDGIEKRFPTPAIFPKF